MRYKALAAASRDILRLATFPLLTLAALVGVALPGAVFLAEENGQIITAVGKSTLIWGEQGHPVWGRGW